MLEQLEIPQVVKDCLRDFKLSIHHLLGDNLVGIYVHGSISMGCFKPGNSDIDVLIVIEDALEHALKLPLLELFDRLAAQYQQKLELSIIRQTVLTHFSHPTPFEFHYPDPERNQLTPPSEMRHDADLAGHFVITRQHGLALAGPPAQDIFPEIPREAYLDSIVQDARWSFNNVMKGESVGVCRVPKYAVLNFCRVLAFIQADLVTSKQTGGEWGLANLPVTYHPLIREALQEYKILDSSQDVACADIQQFAIFAMQKIEELTAAGS